MTANVTTTLSSASPNTQATLLSDIQASMTTAGFNAIYDTVVGGSATTLVYNQVFDARQGKGTAYLAIAVGTDLGVNQVLYDAWDLTAHTGTHGGTASDRAIFPSNQGLILTSINHPELRQVIITAPNGAIAPIGYWRPAIKPSWWDENLFLYCFQVINSNFNSFRSVALSGTPYTSQNPDGHKFSSVDCLNNPNSVNKRDVIPTTIMSPASLQYNAPVAGVSGVSSTDIAQGTCGGLTRFDVLQISGGTSQYLVLNPISAGTLIKIA